jgi:hypothetical protein
VPRRHFPAQFKGGRHGTVPLARTELKLAKFDEICGLRDVGRRLGVVHEVVGLRGVGLRPVGRQLQHFLKFHEVSVYEVSVYEVSVYKVSVYELRLHPIIHMERKNMLEISMPDKEMDTAH